MKERKLTSTIIQEPHTLRET